MLKIAVRGVLAHKFRLVLTVLAVLVSVAFMSGTQVLTATLSTAFDNVFTDVYKDIDAVVRSSTTIDTGFGPQRDNIDASVVPIVQKASGVEAAEGQVRSIVTILDKNNKATSNPNAGPPTFGLNWLTEPSLNGWHLADGGRPPEAPGEVVIDQITAEKAGYQVGDKVRIQLRAGAQDFTIVGLGGFGSTRNYAGSSAALFTTAQAQELLTEPGKFTWINVSAQPGVTQEQLRSNIAQVLPDGTQVVTGKVFTEESQDIFRRFIAFLGTALFIFGLIALVVGAFIIYNTFSIIVTQRTRELALLRATGASRGQVLGSVTFEAFLTGLFASILGIIGGIGLGWVLVQALAQSGSGPAEPITVTPTGMVVSVLVGTVVTTASGAWPAWRASRVPPVAAMRDVAIDTGGRTRVRFVVGAVITLLGAGLLYAGLVPGANAPLPKVGAGVALIFFGVAALLPLLARPMATVLGAPAPGISGRLARANVQRNPRRTASTASALMIGVGLVVLFAILAESVKVSFQDAISSSVTADIIVSSGGNPGQGGFAPEFEQRIDQVPGVGETAGLRFWFAQYEGKGIPMLGSDPAALVQMQKYTIDDGSFDALDMDTIAVGAADSRNNGWKVGDRVRFTFLQGGAQDVEIGAVYRTDEKGTDSGLLLTPDAFSARVPAQFNLDNIIFVKAEPGTDPATLKAPITELMTEQYPTADVQTVAEFGKAQTGILDFFLTIVTALLLLAIIIALIGIINTLLLSVTERTRELGLLRAVGSSRSQVRSTIRWESVIIALLGTIVGTAIGFLFGWALVTAIAVDNPVSLAIPWVRIAVMIAIAGLAGVLAAWYPARRAAKLDVLQAIATE